jgi:hypothetical protein
MADAAPVPVFDFMMVRPAEQMPAERLLVGYVHDTVLTKDRGYAPVDLQSAESPSAIGRLVYQKVFCEPRSPDLSIALTMLRNAVLATLPAYEPPCDNVDGGPEDVAAGGMYRAASYRGRSHMPIDDVVVEGRPAPVDPPPVLPNPPSPLDINDLQRHAYVRVGNLFFLLPDRPDTIGTEYRRIYETALGLMAEAAAEPPAGATFSTTDLVKRLTVLFGGFPPAALVFQGSTYTPAFGNAKRDLFDALYKLYVLRRWASVNFEPVMDALRVLHVLEGLAVDELYAKAKAGQLSAGEQTTLAALAQSFPALRNYQGPASLAGFPLIDSAAALAAWLTARPVVHPIFAELFYYARPFNAIKPIGIGDLKVVKQSLIAYEAGEISDIHNMMKGEKKVRNHRRLEKSEDTFSATSTSSTESTHDTQSTDRFEMKRDAENVLKQDLSVNANVRAQYDNKVVLVAVGAGFAYNRSSTDQSKSAQNFSREVISKAADRVQSTTVQQRSTTKLFETEEMNTHNFDNTSGTGHVAGIYRWVDKRYRSQVYNYGKRLMFEFTLPEPAALYVQSRLRSFEAELVYPQYPPGPELKEVHLGFAATDIDEAKYRELALAYDLSQLPYPAPKTLALIDQTSGEALLEGHGMQSNGIRWSKPYTFRHGSPGYQIDKIVRIGDVYYLNSNQTDWKFQNFFDIEINGTFVDKENFNTVGYKAFYPGNDDITPSGGPLVLPMPGDEATVVVGFQNVKMYAFQLSFEMSASAALIESWQRQVYKVVFDAAQKEVNDFNSEAKTQHAAAVVTWQNRIDQIQATRIHDLIQGQSEAYNRDLIVTELRRQCLAMLTRDYDADTGDDLLTDWETMGERQVTVGYERLHVDTAEDAAGRKVTTVGFQRDSQTVPYPLTDLAEARGKGTFIQFLEQAFEWNRLGWVCYPYFWATTPKWMELMGRLDDADPSFTAFLRAGAIKVLVAVTPAYDDAVLHFLATREPWEGGPAPVIGDPLYLPMFEELHKQQDDLYGGVPDGEPWEFTLPTSLVYLEGSETPLPTLPQPQP